MKQCIQCGRQLPDAANFCPGCGAMQSAEGPKTDKWGVPQPAEGSRNAPPANEWRTASDPAPAADDLWAMPPVPETPKKKGFKARYVVIPILLAVVCAAGVFAYRVLKHPSQERWYDENGNLSSIDYYDSKGIVLKEVEYDEEGNQTYVTEFRETDDCDDIDTSDVEDIDGVKTVECRQVFQAEGNGDPEEYSVFMVIGFDWRGKMLAWRMYSLDGDEQQLRRSAEYELDFYGNYATQTLQSEDGSYYTEQTFENHYSFGRIVSSETESEITGNGQESTRSYTIEYRY